jgi:hypothetical protein
VDFHLTVVLKPAERLPAHPNRFPGRFRLDLNETIRDFASAVYLTRPTLEMLNRTFDRFQLAIEVKPSRVSALSRKTPSTHS